MKSACPSLLFLIATVLAGLIPSAAYSQALPLQIGDRRELFVDKYLIERMEGVRLTLHHPREEGKVLEFNNPWEGAFCGYGTVIKDGTVFRMYYRGVPIAGKDGNPNEVTCYAESVDGRHWEKPNLGIHLINGSKNNNVVLASAAPVTHNFSPFLDTNPNVPAGERYKAVGGTDASGLIAYKSADGIHWKKISDKPVITDGMFDSQNVVFWSENEKQYVCYFRTWSGGGYKGFRSVSRATSPDFVNWSDTKPMDFGGTPLEHLYTQQTAAYYRAPQIYVAIGARFMPDRQVVSDEQAAVLNVNPKYYKDCSDAIFMTSRGENSYERTFMESFIRPGVGLRNWVSRSNYPLLNVVETGPAEMSVYLNEDYAQPTAHVKRYSMRIDGFSSLEAGFDGGTVVTKPIVFSGNELEINYATSAAGGIRIEIQDVAGKPLEGFSLEECQPVIGNEIKRAVVWKSKRELTELAGKTVRLKFEMKDADLYAMKFNNVREPGK